MGLSNGLNMDVRGLLDVEAQLALLQLPATKRKRLLNRVALRLRTQWRQRIRDQRDLALSPFAPRKIKRKGQKKRMLTGLAKSLHVVRLTNDHAQLGWGVRKLAMIANTHNKGMTYRVTAAQLRSYTKNTPRFATREQAKRMRRLGYKRQRPGKNKRGKQNSWRPGVAWIQENIKYGQAGLVIQKLKGEKLGPPSWDVKIPAREFFGIASQQEVSALVAHLLPQILNSPR